MINKFKQFWKANSNTEPHDRFFLWVNNTTYGGWSINGRTNGYDTLEELERDNGFTINGRGSLDWRIVQGGKTLQSGKGNRQGWD